MKFFRKYLLRWYVIVPVLAVCVFAVMVLLSLSAVFVGRGDWTYDGLPNDFYVTRTSSTSIMIEGKGAPGIAVLGYVYKLSWDDRYIFAARIMDMEYGQQTFDDDTADYYILDTQELTTTRAITREEFQTRCRVLIGVDEPEWTRSTDLARQATSS